MTQARSIDLSAAADFLGPAAIEVPIFEKEILDVVRRSSVALKRFKTKRATGHPHRYFEQTAIATASSVDPRNLAATATGPTRVERPAFIKASTAQTNVSMFDKDVTEQQGQFDQVVATDIDDITNAVEVLRGQMLWTGSDTSLTAPTTFQWMGALAQIAGGGGQSSIVNATCAPGVSIIDTIKTTIANMMGQQNFDVMPTGIYVNPILADYIDQEAKAAHIDLKTREVVAGVTVKYLSTQAGDLPLIPDVYMPNDTTARYGFMLNGSNKNYYAVIMTEPLTEIAYISGKKDDPNPRLFQLGLTGNLAGQFVAVKFDTLIIKGAGYAHGLVAVQRA